MHSKRRRLELDMSTLLLSMTFELRPHFSHGARSRSCSGLIPKSLGDDGELMLEDDLCLVGNRAVLVLSAGISSKIEIMNPRADRSVHVQTSWAAHREVTPCCFLGHTHFKHGPIQLVSFLDVFVGQLFEQVLLLVSQIVD